MSFLLVSTLLRITFFMVSYWSSFFLPSWNMIRFLTHQIIYVVSATAIFNKLLLQPLPFVFCTIHFSSSSHIAGVWLKPIQFNIFAQTGLISLQLNNKCWQVSGILQKTHSPSIAIPNLFILSLVNRRLLQAIHKVKIAWGLAWFPIKSFLHSIINVILYSKLQRIFSNHILNHI